MCVCVDLRVRLCMWAGKNFYVDVKSVDNVSLMMKLEAIQQAEAEKAKSD